MKIETLKLLASFLEDADRDAKKEIKDNWGKNIVILQRGWVMIGDLSKAGEYFTLRNCSIIRRWGTTKGLGQIALEGIQDDTILDACPETRFHELTVIGIMKCV